MLQYPLSRVLAIFFIAPILCACKRDAPLFAIDNLNGGKIEVFGHAGMGLGFKFPLDTYESIEPVLRIGADGSEMDVQITKDSVLVLFHDKYLEDRTPCTTGLVNDKLWSEIWGCHIACPYSSSIKLISFNELMSMLEASDKNPRDYTFTFDCKIYTNTTNFTAYLNCYANALIKAIDDHSLQNNILIESQDTLLLRLLMNKRPGLKLFIYPPDFETGLLIAKQMNLYGITLAESAASKEQIKTAHLEGIRVTLWGVDTHQQNMDAVFKSPDHIQTDKPIHLLKVFNRYKN